MKQLTLKAAIGSLHLSALLIGTSEDKRYVGGEVAEISAADADLIKASYYGDYFDYDTSLTKAQLQSLYTETLGTEPSNRLSAEKLQIAIDEFNRPAAGLADVVEK